ncbi:hypothetical protein ACH5RR_037231 [Cinchona calisaya]|uniref:Aspartic peptidase DDI1-type domain-containing protein n=1 Tax=Cinchona calisaya TaxID=153742 RepID=A0ABD2Y5I0_9GENT
MQREHENLRVTTRNLEMQLGQIARQNNERPVGTLPSDTLSKPRDNNQGREHVQVVSLRSGKLLEPKKVKDNESKKMKNGANGKEDISKSKDDNEEPSKALDQHNKSEEHSASTGKQVSIPFPQRLKEDEKMKKFRTFLEIFKKIKINLPFIEAIENMPSYAKFMKQILSSKRRLMGDEILCLNEGCSAIIQRNLPPKLKDPDSFSISCEIGRVTFQRALCDLGASINLMPHSTFKSLNGGGLKPTNVTLQLADRSGIPEIRG